MKKLVIIRAHFLASLAGAIAGIVTAQCYMGLHLAPMRMLMGMLFAPVLAPVSVVLVLATVVLRRTAPQPHFAAMAVTYLIVMGMIVFVVHIRARRSRTDR